MNEGDYVLIQFGHNDAKNKTEADIQNRYTDADGDVKTEGSFKIPYTKIILNQLKKRVQSQFSLLLLFAMNLTKMEK